jgi:hypothetical protein
MTAPPSPPANRHRLPSWLDVRLVLGILLVLVSVLVGARVVASANSSVRVWAVRSDLSAGSVLTAGDLKSVRVRLFDNADRYLATGRSPVGRSLSRDIGSGELLPRDALRARPCGSLLSIPVNAQHLPAGIAKGQRIDVFATPKGGDSKETTQVLRGVAVQSAARPKGGLVASGALWSITVRVPAGQVGAVVRAIRTADLDVAVAEDGTGAEDPCGTAAGAEPNASPSPSPSASPSRKPGGGAAPAAESVRPR